jgi:acyl-CoA synthetase (AMP-forming)/AMP-acid ligase II
MSIADLVERNARLFGPRLAFATDDRNLTHAEFARRAFGLGNALRRMGVAHQGRVAILMRNRLEMLEAMYGAACAGLIGVTLNWRLAPAELIRVCLDCEPEVLIFEPAFAEAAADIAARCPTIRLQIVVGEAKEQSLAYEALLDGTPTTRPEVTLGDETISCLVYTSGTTGDAKGVMLSHGAMVGAARISAWEGGSLPTDRMLIVMPLFHIGGQIEQMSFWVSGAATFLRAQFEPGEVLALIERSRLTAAHLAPTMIAMLLDHPDIARKNHTSLRLVHYGSAPIPVPLLRRAINTFGAIFVQLYGMTECVLGTVLKAHQHVPDGDEDQMRRLSSARPPYLGVEVRIEDDSGAACAPLVPGEVLLRGPALMSGYWNRSGLSISALRGGWMHTGDIGYLDGENFLFVVDRKKDMIISGGENIYSREVEDALLTHQLVREAAVVGVPDPTWGESVFAFIVPHAGAALDASVLIAHCRERIASYKKPQYIRCVESLPRTHNGKIDKKALRVMARDAIATQQPSNG